MNRHFTFTFVLLLLSGLVSEGLMAQGAFSKEDYEKALWMTTRFYGGQRSGENNWLIYDHLPAGVDEKYRGTAFIEDQDTDGYDLSGGWHDCGDHVKFGQTQFFSGYLLLKGYAEFPEGYGDYYSYDYKGYKNSGQWNWEQNGHDPNGIPDILDEVKHATDFFIKCARNSSTFYYQVGQGDPDHATWVTAVKMQTQDKSQGGQIRTVYKNPAGASMASFCGATLALMARVYEKFDPAYAAKCLEHAKYAYDYAKANPGTAGTGDGGFYDPANNWKDDYATMCAELFWATGDEAYKNEVIDYTIRAAPGQGGDISFNYSFDYSNNGELAMYNLALLGKEGAADVLNTVVNNEYLGNAQNGVYQGGNTMWGPTRYNGNAAFVVALNQKLQGTHNTPDQFIYSNVDWLLGDNAGNLSFVVGFGDNYPSYPHHRNIYLRDDNPSDKALTIPEKNRQIGHLVGGTRNPGSFDDSPTNYQQSEGGIDYNAGLVGALGYLRSVLDPVDPGSFGHPAPDLGEDQSICGLSELTLNSNIPTDGKKTFTWYKGEQQIHAASTSRNSITVNEPGIYKCVLDSAGEWSTEGKVTVLGELPDVALGSDQVLCDPAYVTLDAGVQGLGINYEWTKDGEVIRDASEQIYSVYSAGTYGVTISATGCPSKSAEVTVTSKLPTAGHDTVCEPALVYLTVSGNGGPYEWYDVETGGTPLATGTSYEPQINSSKTFYVRDASSLAVTAGPSAANNQLSGATNGGAIGVSFTAEKAFSITGLTVLPYVYSCGNGEQVTMMFNLMQNGQIIGTYTSDPVDCQGTQSGTPFNTYYPVTFSTPIEVPEAGEYVLTPTTVENVGNQLAWFESGADYSSMGEEGIITIAGDTRSDRANSFPGIFDIQIQAGSNCARTPVFAVLDESVNCTVTNVSNPYENAFMVYPNPAAESFNLKGSMTGTVKVFDEMGRLVETFSASEGKTFGNNLSTGLYHVILYKDNKKVQSVNVIKQ